MIRSSTCQFNNKTIREIEKDKNATYIVDLPLKVKGGGYVDAPFSIFYTKEVHPQGSNWFAIGFDYMNQPIITNAIEVEGITFCALKNELEQYVHSSYKRNCVSLGGLAIDGGLDYTRILGDQQNSKTMVVQLKVTKDGLIEV